MLLVFQRKFFLKKFCRGTNIKGFLLKKKFFILLLILNIAPAHKNQISFTHFQKNNIQYPSNNYIECAFI